MTQAGLIPVAWLVADRMRQMDEARVESRPARRKTRRELPLHPRYQPLLGADGALGIPILIDGPAEVQRLDRLIEGLRGGIERMAAGKAWPEVRGLIQAHRRANRTLGRSTRGRRGTTGGGPSRRAT